MTDGLPIEAARERSVWRWRDRQALFHIGLALGLLHLPLSLEFSITLTHHGALIQSLVLFLYPLAIALMGLGAAVARIRPRMALGSAPMRIAGAALLLFLWAALRANFLVNDPGSLTLAGLSHLASLGAWFLALGMGLAGALQRVRSVDPKDVGSGWAIHLTGIVLGYLATEPAIVHVGPNALLAVSGLVFLVIPRSSLIALPLLLLILHPAGLEHRLEALRELESWDEGVTVGIGTEGNLSDEIERDMLAEMRAPIFEGWSRYGQVRIVPVDARRLLVLYNLKRQYVYRPYTLRENTMDPAELRRRGTASGSGMAVRTLLYTCFDSSERLLFSGVGSGRSFTRLTFRPGKEVTAIERDPAAARYFSQVRPADTDHIFSDLDFLVADGRHAIEIQTDALDAIVMESSRYQPPHSMLPVTTPHYLYTREALATCMRKLQPEGLLAIEFSRTADDETHRLVPYQVIESLRALEVPFTLRRAGALDDLTVFASPTGAGLDSWMKRVGGDDLPGVVDDWDPAPLARWVDYELTDETPLVGWVSMSSDDRRLLITVASGAVALALVLVLLLYIWEARGKGWNPIPFFFAIGLGHSIVQFHAFYAWRSFFGDDLLTIIRLIMYFLLFGAVGSWLAGRLPRSVLRPGPRVAWVMVLLALHFSGIANIPFEEGRAWIRELYGLLALVPGGILLGAYFPLGLARARREGVAPSFAADAFGTLAGYALMYLVYVPAGATAFAAVGTAFYAAATLLFRDE